MQNLSEIYKRILGSHGTKTHAKVWIYRENASHTITIGESDRGKEKEKNRSQRENHGKSSFPSTIPTSRTGIRFQTSPSHRPPFQPPQISQKCIKWTDDVVERRNFLSSKNAKRISWCKWASEREREREREREKALILRKYKSKLETDEGRGEKRTGPGSCEKEISAL